MKKSNFTKVRILYLYQSSVETKENQNPSQNQILEKQKGVVKDVLSKAAANVFSG